MSFVHLHVHSQYSILDATASLAGLVKKASDLKMPALALTDHGALFGAVDFYKLCKDAHIKPLIGCEVYLAPKSRFDKKKEPGLPFAFHLTLIAKNSIGYHNLCKLSSYGYTEGFYYTPRIDLELLTKYKEGLICLSGCLESPIAYAAFNQSHDAFLDCIATYKTLFGEDFYFEVERHKSQHEELQLDGMLEEAWLYQQYQETVQKQEKLIELFMKIDPSRCIATNNVHYLERAEWKAHEVLLNIQSGEPVEVQGTPNPKRVTFSSHEMYFKSQEEMLAAFSDHPEFVTRTCEVADTCSLEIDLKTKHYPVFIPDHLREKKLSKKEREQAVVTFLQELAEKGIVKRYTPQNLAQVAKEYPGKDPLQVVQERLKYEMEIISSKGMCDYLLIVWDFINWAKRNGIPMGPGRGSGAGSIILYLIEVTDIEPLQFNLFFERFINPERVSYPDIDVDICMARRNEVINYTIQRFGKENVAQIITFGSMKARMVIKDVARALGIPLSKVNQIAKLIPEDLNITLDKALEKDPDLKASYDRDEEVQRMIDIGRKLEGSVRSTGLHAAGMIVSAEPLVDHIPICTAKDADMLVTQFAMKPVEQAGMLKIDFLGLKTLTCIQIAADAIFKETGRSIDWVNLPLDDAPTFTLLNQGHTLGIFQLESGGMQELSKQLHLDTFEEIIAVVSLYRPGPMDMIPSFIARKHKREPIEYEHPWLKEILEETYGIMVYQEQVMQIAQKLANYSLGEGDVLRRAMGKKDMKEMTQQRQKFLQGAVQNGIDEETAGKIFDKMEKFAEYGFNKSHAAAYGYLSYVTAYFKANYPSQWMAALMTCDRDDISKVAKFFHESRGMHIPILPPDINESGKDFIATASGIRFAMSGIKGVGEGVVDAIIEERNARGAFSSLYDFVSRVDIKRVGKKAIELLVEAGCFDTMMWHRDELKASLDSMTEEVLRKQKEESRGVQSLFAKIETENPFLKPPKLARLRAKEEQLLREKELLGFFLTGHPLDTYKDLLSRLGCITLQEIERAPLNSVFRVACVIEEVGIRVSSKTQKKFAILTISDGGGGKFELPVWPEMYEECSHFLFENQLIFAVVAKEKREESSQLSCKWLGELKNINEERLLEADSAYDKAKAQVTRQQVNRPRKQATPPTPVPEAYVISIDIDKLRASHLLTLQHIVRSSPGPTPLLVRFCSQDQEIATLTSLASRGIEVTSTLSDAIKQIPSIV